MPKRKSERAELVARATVEQTLRKLASQAVALRTAIATGMRKHALPACPYDAVIGDIEEYLQACADEFADPPEGPCLQSLDAAHAAVRAYAQDEGPSKAYDELVARQTARIDAHLNEEGRKQRKRR